MAAAAHVEHNLSVAAGDDMDLLSDSGLDFAHVDGDIELDLDPEPPTVPQDDDVSVKDAPTDAGPDAHVDHDDLMTDHDAHVDEDTVLYDDEEQVDATFVNHGATSQGQALVQEEEDLIDYSDDEEEPTPTNQPTAFYTPIDSYQSVEEHLDSQSKSNQENVHAGDNDFGTYDGQVQAGNDGVYNAKEENHEHVRRSEPEDEASDHTDGEDGGVQIDQDTKHQTNTNKDQHEAEQEETYEDRTITVEYKGNELWLFQHHDEDHSGDWLIEDMSVLQSSLSDLFQALRAALGEDITQETELGLRFSYLQGIEIYEDNTACVAVSLERLLDLYHTLNAQDGVNEPDSFYMCLLSRPRFATLLSDIAKHAELGNGYSGLNAAIQAGETHFGNAFSGHSTDHESGEWDIEEGQQEQHDGTESTSNTGKEAEPLEHEEEDYENEANGEERSHKASSEHVDHSTAEHATHEALIAPDNEANPQKAPDSEAPALQKEIDNLVAQQDGASLLKIEQEEVDDDAIDYSDVEDDVAPQTKAPDALSPSSATVQGDDPTTGDAQTQPTEATEHGEGQYPGHDDTAADAALSGDVQSFVEEQLGHDDNTESYQDYTQEYNQDDPFEEFQMGNANNYAEEPNFGGYANHDSTGYDYDDLDQQLQNDFVSGADFDDTTFGDSTNAANGYTEEHDFLDLDNPAEWVPDEEGQSQVPADDVPGFSTHNEEEEGGAAERPVAATSTTADPVAASSTDLQQTSPQGQKRSIDEVSDSVGDAIDLTDTKRPRV